jgi:hypothetical protein
MERKLNVVEFLIQLESVEINAKTTSKNIPLHYLVRHSFDDSSDKEQFLRFTEISWKILNK